MTGGRAAADHDVMHPGWLRRLTLGFLLCLSIDVANPLLPGSQRFDAAESIDGVRTPRAGGPLGRPAAAELAAMTVARRTLPGAEPPAPADDH